MGAVRNIDPIRGDCDKNVNYFPSLNRYAWETLTRFEGIATFSALDFKPDCFNPQVRNIDPIRGDCDTIPAITVPNFLFRVRNIDPIRGDCDPALSSSIISVAAGCKWETLTRFEGIATSLLIEWLVLNFRKWGEKHWPDSRGLRPIMHNSYC